jgi:hypothetical protein
MSYAYDTQAMADEILRARRIHGGITINKTNLDKNHFFIKVSKLYPITLTKKNCIHWHLSFYKYFWPDNGLPRPKLVTKTYLKNIY